MSLHAADLTMDKHAYKRQYSILLNLVHKKLLKVSKNKHNSTYDSSFKTDVWYEKLLLKPLQLSTL